MLRTTPRDDQTDRNSPETASNIEEKSGLEHRPVDANPNTVRSLRSRPSPNGNLKDSKGNLYLLS